MLLRLFSLLAAANCKAGRFLPALDCLFSSVASKYLLFGLKARKKVWISSLGHLHSHVTWSRGLEGGSRRRKQVFRQRELQPAVIYGPSLDFRPTCSIPPVHLHIILLISLIKLPDVWLLFILTFYASLFAGPSSASVPHRLHQF